MAGASTKKRSHADSAAAGKLQRPNKKQRKVLQYNSDSEEDLDNAVVDDIASLSGSESGSDSDVGAPAHSLARKSKGPKSTGKSAKKNLGRKDERDSQADGAGAESDNDDEDKDEEDHDDDEVDDEDDEFTNSEGETSNIGGSRRPKSKRNNPDAFATSLQKILSTVRRRTGAFGDSNSMLINCGRRNFPIPKSRTLSYPAASRRRRQAETSLTRR